MANKRKTMRRIRQILRLAWESGLGQRQIARSLSMSPTTVGDYLRRSPPLASRYVAKRAGARQLVTCGPC